MCNMAAILEQPFNKKTNVQTNILLRGPAQLGSHLRYVAYQNDYKMVLCQILFFGWVDVVTTNSIAEALAVSDGVMA